MWIERMKDLKGLLCGLLCWIYSDRSNEVILGNTRRIPVDYETLLPPSYSDLVLLEYERIYQSLEEHDATDYVF